MRKFTEYLSKNSYFLIVVTLCLVAVLSRFVNFQEYLYFITDQGRDALVLKEIVGGNLRLIGPTSGLQGFFLGPLWYYLGLPGYVISGGNPYGISLWYVALACTAIPLFYLLSKALFPKDSNWRLVLLSLLCFIPGSLAGSIFIWNPLIAIPILAAVVLTLERARESRLWLVASFVLLGSLLQSEFAYGIFLVPVLFAVIFWIRRKFSIVDYALAGIGFGVTLVPQILFELRNQFLMTKALMVELRADQISWLELFQKRPEQLLDSTVELLVGQNQSAYLVGICLVLLLGNGLLYLRRHQDQLKQEGTHYLWQIIALITVLPYLGYMLWRSNHGNFFGYYITPHFIVLLPLIVLGLKQATQFIVPIKAKLGWRFKVKALTTNLQVITVTVILTISALSYGSTFIFPHNQAGLKVIDRSVETVLTWQLSDSQYLTAQGLAAPQSSIITFTPNFSTVQYDFLTDWKIRQGKYQAPHTQVRPDDSIIYLIIEPDREIPEVRFSPWYKKVSDSRVLIRKQQIGVVTVETWMNPSFASQFGFTEYVPTVREDRNW